MVLLLAASFQNAAFCNAAFCLTAVHAFHCLRMAFLRILLRESHWLTFVVETGWSCRNWLSCWDWLHDCHIAAISIDSHATNAVVYSAWFRLIWWIACLCFREHAYCRACYFNVLNVELVLWKGVSTWWKSFHTLCTYLGSSHPKILRNRRLSRNLLYYR